MPAWSKGGIVNEAIWDMGAFLQQMPALSPARYLELVEASEGHSHGGLVGYEDMHGTEGGAKPFTVKPGGHDHSDGHSH